MLLELLTGLPPLDENREGNDLVSSFRFACVKKLFFFRIVFRKDDDFQKTSIVVQISQL